MTTGSFWGVETSIDLYDCDPAIIRDAEKIKAFVIELCSLIGMKRFGDTVVVNFGEEERVAGFSMTQLIETSLVSGHFANMTNAAYLNVFSCKSYDCLSAAEFCKEFFQAKNMEMTVNYRR